MATATQGNAAKVLVRRAAKCRGLLLEEVGLAIGLDENHRRQPGYVEITATDALGRGSHASSTKHIKLDKREPLNSAP
jgi:hypothetical protein